MDLVIFGFILLVSVTCISVGLGFIWWLYKREDPLHNGLPREREG